MIRIIFFLFVISLLNFSSTLTAQPTPHTVDFRLTAVEKVSPKYTYLYSGKQIAGPISWAAFGQATPFFMLFEAGPSISLGPASVTIRVGAYIVPTKNGARIEHQEAIVVFASWRGISFLSINEFSPLEGIRYYYEQHLAWRSAATHLEAVFLDGQFRPFFGPWIELPVGRGRMLFWLAWRTDGPPGKLVRWGYKINF